MGNCASSKFVPWAGRNETTLAAKTRKKAAKDILTSYREYSTAHASYLESLKSVGNNLVLVMAEEDKGLYHIQAPPVKIVEEPSNYRTSWSQTPGALAENPVSDDSDVVKEVVMEKAVAEEKPAGGPSNYSPNPPASTDYSDGVPPSSTADSSNHDTWQLQKVPTAQPQNFQMISSNNPPPRGAGLSQLVTSLNGLFLEAIEAAKPLSSVLAIGPPKNYAAPPPLPPHVQGGPQYGMPQTYGKPPESLWETLEILVAYERFRSKEIKALEMAKWDYQRLMGKLGKQSSKKVSEARADKQQKVINKTHARVQELQGNMNRMTQSVESYSRTIEAVKAQMLFPAVLLLLPGLIQMWAQMAGIHSRQFQLLQELAAKGSLVNSLANGPAVLFTQISHHKGTQNLENALVKWDQAFTANMASTKKMLVSAITWLNRVNPSGANVLIGSAPAPPPQGYQNQNPYPSTPAVNPYPQPQYPSSNNSMPHVTHPSEENQMIPHPSSRPPSQEVMQDFLGGPGSVGEPLLALCHDWKRSMDKLPEKTVKDALFAYKNWVKDSYEKQNAELKQGKKVDDLRKQLAKAEQKYEGMLVKERDFRSTLERPEATPMSRALSISSNPHQNSPSYSSPAPNPYPPPSTPPSNSSIQGAYYSSSPLPPPALSPSPPPPAKQPIPAASPPPPADAPSESGLIPYQPPVETYPSSDSKPDQVFDKAAVKARAKEQAKEVKAFTIAKDVDLTLGALEGLRQKVKDEQASFEVMAVEARKSAVTGLEQSLPNYFMALTTYATVASQMYGVIHFQHTRQWR